VVLGAITFFWLLSKIFNGDEVEVIPSGTPPVVIVTTIDPRDRVIADRVKQNRKDYAKRWGMQFVSYTSQLQPDWTEKTDTSAQAMQLSSPARPTTSSITTQHHGQKYQQYVTP
jgi:hypothetical protein